jgi:hypothetical protein
MAVLGIFYAASILMRMKLLRRRSEEKGEEK